MCSVKLTDRLPCTELRYREKERLGLEDTVAVLQRNTSTGHVLGKDSSKWLKKCMDYEGVNHRGRPKRT